MEQVFLKIVNMSITAAYCALAVMLLRLLFKKLPKIYSYALWIIVAFRLICPVSFESVFSLMRVPTEAVSANVTVQKLLEVSAENNKAAMDENKPLMVATAPVDEVEATAIAVVDVTALQIAFFWGSILWIIVAVVFFGYGAGSYMRMRWELSDATEFEQGVFQSDRLRTPFVLGVFKPQIYLPEGLTSTEKVYVLEHERTHIHRGDHIVKMAAFFLLCVHWFNPVLWFSFLFMCKDMEMSCDEKVVKKLSFGHTVETKKEYASTLIALASKHPFSFGVPLAFGEGNIKNRINNVLQYKKQKMVVRVVLAVIVMAVVFLLIGNPKKDMEDRNIVERRAAVTGTGMVDEKGNGYYYGVVLSDVEENMYFTLQVPEECKGEVSYYVKIEEQSVQSIDFYMEELVNIDVLKCITEEKNVDVELAWLQSVYWENGKYQLCYPEREESGEIKEQWELIKKYDVLCNSMNQAKIIVH